MTILGIIRSWRGWRVDLAGAVFCIASTLVASLGGFRPLMRQKDSQAAVQSTLNSRRGEHRQLQGRIRELDCRQADIRDALSTDTLRLQTVLQTNRRLADVADLAAQSGLKVDEVHPEAVRSGQRFEVVPIRLTGQGPYTSCLAFLRRLQEKFPDMGGVGLDLSARTEPTETVAAFQFHLEWYTAPRTMTPK
jgi:hypothetical protein